MERLPHLFLGADPGKGGAFVVLDRESRLVFASKTPTYSLGERARDKEYDLRRLAQLIAKLDPSRIVAAGVELSRGMPRQSSRSTHEQGRGVGVWQGVLAGVGIDAVYMFEPVEWQRISNLHGKGVDYSKRKELWTAAALNRWSELPIKLKKDRDIADAAWIAEAARITHTTRQ